MERAEAPAPKVTPRTPVQTTVTPPSSTQPVPSSRPQAPAASTPATPSTPAPATATIPTPVQVRIWLLDLTLNLILLPDDETFCAKRGSEAVD